MDYCGKTQVSKKALDWIGISLLSIGLGVFVVRWAEYFPFLLSPLIIAVTAALSFTFHKAFLTPLTIMSVSWLLPPLTTFFDHQWILNAKTWFIIYGSFLMFCFGYLSILLNQKTAVSLPRVRAGNIWPERFTRHIIYILFMVSMVAFSINMSRVLRHGGIELYFTAGLRTVEHIFGQNPLINQFFFLSMLTVVLCVLYSLIYGSSLLIAILGFVSFGSLFFQGIRGNIIRTVILVLFVYLIIKRRVNWKWLIGGMVLSFLTFELVTVFRDPSTYLSTDFWKLQSLIAQKLYLYIAPNFANLQEEMLRRDNFLYGKTTFSSLIKILTLDGMLIQTRLLEPPNHFLVNEAYNVGTYLRDFYIDFGLLGILIGPWLIGAMSALITLKFARRPSMGWLFTYAVLLTMITFSWWFNEFKNVQLLFFIVLIHAINRIAPKRKN